MTTPPDLEALYAEANRYARRALWVALAVIVLLIVSDLTLVLIGGGRFLARDAGIIVGLGGVALVMLWGCYRAQIALEKTDALLMAQREQLNAARPILEHIEKAHAMGAAAMFPPPEPAPPEQPRKLH
jgi:hypothetical protein